MGPVSLYHLGGSFNLGSLAELKVVRARRKDLPNQMSEESMCRVTINGRASEGGNIGSVTVRLEAVDELGIMATRLSVDFWRSAGQEVALVDEESHSLDGSECFWRQNELQDSRLKFSQLMLNAASLHRLCPEWPQVDDQHDGVDPLRDELLLRINDVLSAPVADLEYVLHDNPIRDGATRRPLIPLEPCCPERSKVCERVRPPQRQRRFSGAADAQRKNPVRLLRRPEPIPGVGPGESSIDQLGQLIVS